MIRQSIREVVFVCPIFVTGGTEAIHQACDALNANQIKSSILYIGAGARHQVVNGCLVSSYAGENVCSTAFSAYHVQVADNIPLAPETLIVFPEIQAFEAENFRQCTCAIWWLSVDNAFAHLPSLREESSINRVFRNPNIYHLAQSEYALTMLLSKGCENIHFLSDYTTAIYNRPKEGPNQGSGVMYNQKRGADLATLFFKNASDLIELPLNNMTREQLIEKYDKNCIFIDFGNLPGKDRMPREAAGCGCIVFLRNAGAGQFIADFPIPAFFKFNDVDIHSGELSRRIKTVLDGPKEFWCQQNYFRNGIYNEKKVFLDSVRDLISPEIEQRNIITVRDCATLMRGAVGP